MELRWLVDILRAAYITNGEARHKGLYGTNQCAKEHGFLDFTCMSYLLVTVLHGSKS